ncbi:hypothetical protein FRC10_009168 [Ceratobasidium sp. 414]|nr:hypothetical protein FRC10_009168 [Ceratobasidium sp. 414]
MSIIRWITFNDKGNTSPAASTATAVAVSIFNLSGLVNVVLILTTRTNVLLFGSRGVMPVPNVPEEQDDHAQMQEGGANAGVLAGEGNRRWFRNSATNPGVATRRSTQEMEEAEDTGFGGPRVRLGREDDDEENHRIQRTGYKLQMVNKAESQVFRSETAKGFLSRLPNDTPGFIRVMGSSKNIVKVDN